MDALKSLLDNEKGLVGVLVIIGATVFVILGKMPIEDWKTFTTYIFTAYAASTAVHESAVALAGGRKPKPLVVPPAVVPPVVQIPPIAPAAQTEQPK